MVCRPGLSEVLLTKTSRYASAQQGLNHLGLVCASLESTLLSVCVVCRISSGGARHLSSCYIFFLFFFSFIFLVFLSFSVCGLLACVGYACRIQYVEHGIALSTLLSASKQEVGAHG